MILGHFLFLVIFDFGSFLIWAGLGWAGLGLAGLGWAALGWAGLGEAALGFAGLMPYSSAFNELY